MNARLVLTVVLLAGCSKDSEPEPTVPLDPGPVVSAKPVDHLAPGELVAGTERAFGLVLPRGFHVRARFTESVLAEGPASAKNLAQYFATQVKDGQARVQPAQALFEDVRANAEPSRLLRIRIEETAGGTCQVQVNDSTPPADPGGTVDERMKRVGRSADGAWQGRDKLE